MGRNYEKFTGSIHNTGGSQKRLYKSQNRRNISREQMDSIERADRARKKLINRQN